MRLLRPDADGAGHVQSNRPVPAFVRRRGRRIRLTFGVRRRHLADWLLLLLAQLAAPPAPLVGLAERICSVYSIAWWQNLVPVTLQQRGNLRAFVAVSLALRLPSFRYRGTGQVRGGFPVA